MNQFEEARAKIEREHALSLDLATRRTEFVPVSRRAAQHLREAGYAVLTREQAEKTPIRGSGRVFYTD